MRLSTVRPHAAAPIPAGAAGRAVRAGLAHAPLAPHAPHAPISRPAAPVAPGPATPERPPLAARLRRAERLGHCADRLAAAEAPPHRTVPPVRQHETAAALRRAVGFELELQVLLSSGQAEEAPEESGAYAFTIEDLRTGAVRPRPQVRNTPHRVVLQGGAIYYWDQASAAKPDGERVIRPANHDPQQSGRWLLDETKHAQPYFDPLLKKEEKVFQEPDLIEGVEDHTTAQLAPSLSSILELVTAPRDEFGPEKGFLEPMQRAADITREIVKQTQGLTRLVRARAVFPQARGDLFLGFDKGEFGVTPQQVASVQATYAVRLDAIPTLVQHMAKTARTSEVEGVILRQASAAAGKVMRALLERGSLTRPDEGLSGLVHALCLYLTGGHQEFRGQLGDNPKSYSPLLHRNDFDLWVNQAGFLGPEGVKLLRYAARRSSLIDLLAEANGRERGEPLLTIDKQSPTVGHWLEQVLSGADDPLRSFSRFGRARRIPHEQVGPEGGRSLAPVLEERQVPSFGKYPSADVPIDQWVLLAQRYREMLQQLNQPKGGNQSGGNVNSNQPLPTISLNISSPSPSQSVSVTPTAGARVILTHREKGTTVDGEYVTTTGGYYAIKVGGLRKPYSVKDYDLKLA